MADTTHASFESKPSLTHTYVMGLDGLGDRMRTLRTERGWTQLELAQRAGLRENSIGRMERGAMGMSIDSAVALAAAFGVSTDTLLTGEVFGGDVVQLPPPGLAEFLASSEGEGLSDEERAGLHTVGHGLAQMGKTPTPYTYAAVVGILRTLR